MPSIVIPVCLLLVHFHPQPVDDCSCFEDAIAFISVILGGFLAWWHGAYAGIDVQLLQTVMPGGVQDVWTLAEKLRWCSLAGAKVGMGALHFSVRYPYPQTNSLPTGILVIFVWRLLAKAILHLVLPPLFRALAHYFNLPHRWFYTPATDYTHMPAENGLHPIPSVIDLPGSSDINGGDIKNVIKRRGRGMKSNQDSKTLHSSGSLFIQEKEIKTGKNTARSGTEVKHYDADGTLPVISFHVANRSLRVLQSSPK